MFLKDLTLTGTTTLISDLIAGVTDGSGKAFSFFGQMMAKSTNGTVVTVTDVTTTNTATLEAGKIISLTGEDLSKLKLSGNTNVVTLFGKIT